VRQKSYISEGRPSTWSLRARVNPQGEHPNWYMGKKGLSRDPVLENAIHNTSSHCLPSGDRGIFARPQLGLPWSVSQQVRVRVWPSKPWVALAPQPLWRKGGKQRAPSARREWGAWRSKQYPSYPSASSPGQGPWHVLQPNGPTSLLWEGYPFFSSPCLSCKLQI
jgi:hypothetical protein